MFKERVTVSRLDGDTQDVFYRYQDGHRGHFNADGDLLYSSKHIELLVLPVVRHTPKGVTLRLNSLQTRFVSYFTNKRFAYSTEEAALRGYIRRKNMQKSILMKHVSACETYHSFAELELKALERKAEVVPA